MIENNADPKTEGERFIYLSAKIVSLTESIDRLTKELQNIELKKIEPLEKIITAFLF